MNRLNIWISVVVIAGITLFLFFGTGATAERINLTVAYAAVMVIFMFALLILIEIANGKIDISSVLTESGGGASMSRFQLLIFTLVVALCFVLIVVHTKSFPSIPKEVLKLLGVSATTYAVGKGIQASGMASKVPDGVPKASGTPNGPPNNTP